MAMKNQNAVNEIPVSKKMLAKAKSEAKQIMDNAKTQSEKIVEESKNKATEETIKVLDAMKHTVRRF